MLPTQWHKKSKRVAPHVSAYFIQDLTAWQKRVALHEEVIRLMMTRDQAWAWILKKNCFRKSSGVPIQFGTEKIKKLWKQMELSLACE